MCITKKSCGKPVNYDKRALVAKNMPCYDAVASNYRSATNVPFATNANARNAVMNGASAATVKPPPASVGPPLRVAKQARRVSEYVGTRGSFAPAGFVILVSCGRRTQFSRRRSQELHAPPKRHQLFALRFLAYFCVISLARAAILVRAEAGATISACAPQPRTHRMSSSVSATR